MARAWSFRRAGGEWELWARWGRWSLWVETGTARFEINGKGLPELLQRGVDPWEWLERLPLRVVSGGAGEPDLQAAFDRVAERLKGHASSGLRRAVRDAALALLVILLFGALPFRPWGWGMWMPALAWVALGAQARGFRGLVYTGFTWALFLQTGLGQGFGASVAFLGLSLVASLAGLGSFARATLAAGALGLMFKSSNGTLGMVAGLLSVGLGTGVWSLRRRPVAVKLEGAARWRAHLVSEALAEVDSSMLWILDPMKPEALPPRAAAIRNLPWKVAGEWVPREIVGGGEHWIFLPEAVLILREGAEALLAPLRAFRLAWTPCAWEGAPPGAGERQLTVHCSGPEGAALVLLFGKEAEGRRFADRFGAWMQGKAELATEPSLPERLFGVRGDAPWTEVKAAYHRAVMRWHPDRHPQATPAEREALEARLRELNEAFDALERERS